MTYCPDPDEKLATLGGDVVQASEGEYRKFGWESCHVFTIKGSPSFPKLAVHDTFPRQ